MTHSLDMPSNNHVLQPRQSTAASRTTTTRLDSDGESLSITLIITFILFGLVLLAFLTFITLRRRRRRRKGKPAIQDLEKGKNRPSKPNNRSRPQTRGKVPASPPSGPPTTWRRGAEQSAVDDLLPRMRALAAERRGRQQRRDREAETATKKEKGAVEEVHQGVDALGIGIGIGIGAGQALPRIEIDLAESFAEESIRGVEAGRRHPTPLPLVRATDLGNVVDVESECSNEEEKVGGGDEVVQGDEGGK